MTMPNAGGFYNKAYKNVPHILGFLRIVPIKLSQFNTKSICALAQLEIGLIPTKKLWYYSPLAIFQTLLFLPLQKSRVFQPTSGEHDGTYFARPALRN